MHFVLKNLPALSNRTVGLINLGENCAEPGWIPDVVAMLGCSGHNAVAIAMDQPIETFVDYALAFNSSQHKPTSDLARRKLKEHIEKFLAENSILVLSTCFREKSFSAILRYCYHEGHVFCLSQGGEFFAGIAQKSIVTFTVSSPLPDEYISCTGSAVLIHPYHESYNKTINSIKLQKECSFSDQVPPMIIDIHLREVQISKREFKVRGFQNPQIFHF